MDQVHFDVAKAIATTMDRNLIPYAQGARAFELKAELWVFVDDPAISTPELLTEATCISQKPLKMGLRAVHYVLPHWAPNGEELITLGLGLTAETVRMAQQRLLDLPSTFEASQQFLINETLEPIRSLGIDPVRMTLVDQLGDRKVDAVADLTRRVYSGAGLIFIEAEAGKGKSVLLASTAQKLHSDKRGKLSVFIPLRKLPLSEGIAWESIAQLIGIVGQGANLLAQAVKSGLVTVFLDGIDEVAGRYDKQLVLDLLNLITLRLGSPDSKVMLSGRRTEARHLHNSDWTVLNVDLPDLNGDDFRAYVAAVFDGITERSKNAGEIELPPEYEELIGSRPADDLVLREKQSIVDWILEVFPEVAKEPSLFFIQGLAAIAIGRRSGNRAPLYQDNKAIIPRVRDVCLSAAVFACIRETSKIDAIAAQKYSVKNQMRALQGLAALASAPPGMHVPTPYEIVPQAFDVDPVNASEVHVAITRQNAKHALLYATEAAGAYRPQFLSDWIRCTMLTQIFTSNAAIAHLNRDQTLQLAASAERAKFTFETLLPSVLNDGAVDDHWRQALDQAIANGTESASANLWFLRASIGDEALTEPVQAPLPLSEITDIEFTGFEIGSELSGEDFFLDGNRVVNSSISSVRLQGVSLSDVSFENCILSDVELVSCDGPITFEGCELSGFRVKNMRSKKRPALQFVNCTFIGDKNLLVQEVAAYGDTAYGSPVVFENCECDCDVAKLMQGEWTAKEEVLNGISRKSVQTMSNEEACLRRVLRAFFPTHLGDGSTLQTRRYIRLSALGRGSMPAGSPGQEALKQVLESVGFTDGGRSDHIYAPWSGVAGASQAGMELRTELLDFLRDGSNCSTRVRSMLTKISRFFS